MVNIKKPGISSFSRDEIAVAIAKSAIEKPVIVDFDETLLLRNSTAEYLNSIKPRIVGTILLKILAVLKPWKLLANSQQQEASRDWFLVFFSTVLLPWNLFFWRSEARKLAKHHSNLELIAELNSNSNTEVVVASLGFKFIIAPILRYVPVKYDRLLACGFWQGLKDRRRGKLAMVEEALSAEKIAGATLITDSIDDLPLLVKVARPLLVLWSGAKYNQPMRDIYLPMMYLHKVKRIGENYIVKSILGDDFPILILALSWLSPQPILHICAILSLVFSFWCIYEYGYYENDSVAFAYEKDPNISQEFLSPKFTMNWWQPWIWSLLLGVAGILALAASNLSAVPEENYTYALLEWATVPFVVWTASLIVSRFCFWLYNYVNKQTRIWLYMVLQFSRYCGFLAVTATNIVGISILFAQIFSRSISYLVYRHAGGKKENWPKLQEKFLRLVLFVLFLIGLSFAQMDWSFFFSWQTLAILLWCGFRGAQHTKQALSGFGWIRDDKKTALS